MKSKKNSACSVSLTKDSCFYCLVHEYNCDYFESVEDKLRCKYKINVFCCNKSAILKALNNFYNKINTYITTLNKSK